MMFDAAAAASSRHRAFISPSMSAPTFPTYSPSSSRSPSPNPNPNFQHSSSSRLSNSSSSSSSSCSHNGRIALALLPAGAVLLDLGGTPVLVTLTLGLLVSYLLDLLRLQSAAFFSIWTSLILSQFAFFFTSSLSLSSLPLTLLSLLLTAQTTFLIGVWISLQFKWLQIENPAIVKTLERLLFACLPISVPPILTFAVVSGLGMANAAYYLAAFSCFYYWLFSIPHASSFSRSKQESSNSDDNQILSPLDCCMHTLYLLFAPPLFRIGSHHAVIFSSASSLCDLFLLFLLPFLFQLYASTRGAMWWVTRDSHQMHRFRVANGAVAVVLVVLCLEIRVVFHSFARYLPLPPPLNILLVTVTMLGGALVMGAYAVGMVKDRLGSAVFTALSVFVSGTGAVVIGFPILV